jgi:hypothetical protein
MIASFFLRKDIIIFYLILFRTLISSYFHKKFSDIFFSEKRYYHILFRFISLNYFCNFPRCRTASLAYDNIAYTGQFRNYKKEISDLEGN